jgi:hypothetical protein
LASTSAVTVVFAGVWTLSLFAAGLTAVTVTVTVAEVLFPSESVTW